MTPREKMLCAILLFIAWGALVITGKVPASEFATGIRDALLGLGVFHAAITNPKE